MNTGTRVRSMVRPCLAGAVLVLLQACMPAADDLQQFVADSKARPGGRIEPLPQIKPYETFAYEADYLRSPFEPHTPAVAEGPDNGIRPDTRRPREFLEEFPLDTLKMVGTLTKSGETYGLIQTNDGLIHRVVSGNFMGQNEGRVIVVTESEIQLVEIIPDGLGGYLEREAAVALEN